MKVGAWVFVILRFQSLLALFEVDYVNIESLDEKFNEEGGVIDFLLGIPGHNGSVANTYIDEADNDPDVVLVSETPDIIVVTMGE